MILTTYFLGHFFGNLAAFLFGYLFGHIFAFILGNMVAFCFGNIFAFFYWDMFALGFGLIRPMPIWGGLLMADFLVFSIALLLVLGFTFFFIYSVAFFVIFSYILSFALFFINSFIHSLAVIGRCRMGWTAWSMNIFSRMCFGDSYGYNDDKDNLKRGSKLSCRIWIKLKQKTDWTVFRKIGGLRGEKIIL